MIFMFRERVSIVTFKKSPEGIVVGNINELEQLGCYLQNNMHNASMSCSFVV